MGIEHITTLHSELPNLFATKEIVPEKYEDFLIIPIEDPELVSPPGNDETFASNLERVPENLENGLLENEGPQLIEDALNLLDIDSLIYEAFKGNHGGAPIPYQPQPHMPPPESLAFYLPFHYYHPDWWGIYLIYEGVLWLAGEILRQTGPKISRRQAFEAARLFLYYHEGFHHKTECFATRLELTHRQPFYKTGFEQFFQKTFGTDDCMEEGLANASALIDSHKKLRTKAIDKAFSNYVEQNPPGYKHGNKYRPDFINVKCVFAENNHNYCMPIMPKKNPEIWRTAPHLFDGNSNIKSRVNYIIGLNSPILNRINFRPCLPPNKLIKKLKRLVGLELVREGGRHQVWKTSAGKTVEIPRHPRDLGNGLLRKILNQVGLNMGLEEFLAS
jgi:predicted RNA binding protein YcfA (HicA-like mRNA interferase family)